MSAVPPTTSRHRPGTLLDHGSATQPEDRGSSRSRRRRGPRWKRLLHATKALVALGPRTAFAPSVGIALVEVWAKSRRRTVRCRHGASATGSAVPPTPGPCAVAGSGRDRERPEPSDPARRQGRCHVAINAPQSWPTNTARSASIASSTPAVRARASRGSSRRPSTIVSGW